MSREAFISHASVDADLARAVCDGLERRGVACWIAPRDIAPEGTYGTEIIKGLRECSVFLIVLTAASADSQQVEREAERASHYQKRIIPLAIGQSEPGERLEFYTAGRQRLAATGTIDDGFLDRLAAVIRGERVAAPLTATDPARSRWPFAVIGAVVVALLAAGAWWIATQQAAPPASPASSQTSTVPPAAPPRPAPENPRPIDGPARPPETKPSAAQRGSVPPVVAPPSARTPESSRGAGRGRSEAAPAATADSASELNIDGAKLRFVAVPGGTYKMGCSPGDDNCAEDEKDVTTLVVDPFQISATEVTQAFWQATMGRNPSDFQGPLRPVEMVSWQEGVAFMARLNEDDKAFEYRLPTEAQWEYAARAGSGTPDSLRAFAWSDLLTSLGSNARPQEVGKKKPNAWGLSDMLGNVAEWCQDWYSPNFQRVVRGGSWEDAPASLRVSARGKAVPSTKVYSIGLRVVRTPR